MKKITGVLLALYLCAIGVFAEEAASSDAQPAKTSSDWKPSLNKPRSSFRDNLYFGGYINLSFGDYSVLGIEPMVGYHVTPKLSSGVKVRYDYIRDDRYAKTRNTSSYGGSIFARYRITKQFYLQVEPASYNYELFYRSGDSAGREWVPYIFAGGGVRQPLSEKSWIYAEVMFDMLQDSKSPYDDWTPFFSIGAGTGF